MNIHIHHFHSKGAVADRAALEQFQKQWATYQKLVDTDSLAHKEVGALLHQALAAISRPFAFLDIACGDAGQMKAALSNTKVKHYHGVDLSEPALELAAKNLEGVPFEVELDHRDFFTALTERPVPADAAWCGPLARGDEPTLNDGETRDEYMQRFARVNRPAWTFFSDAEWDQLCHHVTTCDYPETSATWCAIGREAGFSSSREIYCDPTGFYRIYRYDV